MLWVPRTQPWYSAEVLQTLVIMGHHLQGTHLSFDRKKRKTKLETPGKHYTGRTNVVVDSWDMIPLQESRTDCRFLLPASWPVLSLLKDQRSWSSGHTHFLLFLCAGVAVSCVFPVFLKPLSIILPIRAQGVWFWLELKVTKIIIVTMVIHTEIFRTQVSRIYFSPGRPVIIVNSI